MLLQGILRRAVVRGLIPVNAAQLVDKPKQRPTQLPQPLSPVTVERIGGRRRVWRPAASSAGVAADLRRYRLRELLLRLATPVGGPEPDVHHRAGRPLRGDARAA